MNLGAKGEQVPSPDVKGNTPPALGNSAFGGVWFSCVQQTVSKGVTPLQTAFKSLSQSSTQLLGANFVRSFMKGRHMTLALVETTEPEIAADFDAFWAIQVKKVAKKDARKAWERISPNLYPTIIEASMAWNRIWARQDLTFVPFPATWLNGERWEDSLPKDIKATAAAHVPFSMKAEKYEKPRLSPEIQAQLRKALGR